MAEGYEPKYVDYNTFTNHIIKTATVTGTADGSGFLNTSIAWGDYVILGAKDLYVNNTSYTQPYSVRAVVRGSSANRSNYSVQFYLWDNSVIGASSSMSVKIMYMHI